MFKIIVIEDDKVRNVFDLDSPKIKKYLIEEVIEKIKIIWII